MTVYHVYNYQEWTAAIWAATGGDTIYVHGVYTDSFHIDYKVLDDYLTVDGSDAELKHGMAVQNSHKIIVRGFHITGNNYTAGAEINDSYHDIGVRDIVLQDLFIDFVGPRGIEMGGWNIAGITISNCHIKGQLNGTHGIYLTGAHWKGSEIYPPVDNVTIENCLIELQPEGRHGIQLNGRFRNGIVRNNFIRHAQLCGISLIGCQKFDVLGNVVYGCNRGEGIQIYDYAHSWDYLYNWYLTQKNIDNFRKVHQPCQDILVEFNTFVVGPKQFCESKYHQHDPTENHPGILINNGVHSGFLIDDPLGNYVWIPRAGCEFDFPSKNFLIQNNIIYTPCLNYLDVYHEHEGMQTVLNHNMIWSTKSGTPYIGQYGNVALNLNPINKDPEFIGGEPVYDYVDLWTLPNIPSTWADFYSKFNAYTAIGDQNGVGRKFPIPNYAYVFNKEEELIEIENKM